MTNYILNKKIHVFVIFCKKKIKVGLYAWKTFGAM